MIETNIIEIFSSIQGEGKYVGCRQIFVRLSNCNLKCIYCDTNCNADNFYKVLDASGNVIETFKNPATPHNVAAVINKIVDADGAPPQAVSFTGGEPLLHTQFIKEIAELIDYKIFLESNGTLYNELAAIIDCIDIISMDIKLPSVVGKNLFKEHQRFMEIAKNKDLYIKIVITGETTQEEFLMAIKIVADVSKDILLILQPVTPVGSVKPAAIEQLLSFQALALKYLSDVRIIPQTHKMMNVI